MLISSLRRIVVVTVVFVASSPYGDCGECPRHRTTSRYEFSETDDLPDQKGLYAVLEKLNVHNYTTEQRLDVLHRAYGRVSVNWVFNGILKKFITHVENSIAQDHVPLLKFAKLFPGFDALPRSSGRFRAYHGRFTNMSLMSLHGNATYTAFDNQLMMVSYVRVYNATFVYRNYELLVNNKRIEGSVSGSYDYLDLRVMSAWLTAPKCQLMYGLQMLYDWDNCKAVVKNLGEYDYLSVELEVAVCNHMDNTLSEVVRDVFVANWNKSSYDAQLCKHKLFKDIFNAVE